jgi:hypothetical protein
MGEAQSSIDTPESYWDGKNTSFTKRQTAAQPKKTYAIKNI